MHSASVVKPSAYAVGSQRFLCAQSAVRNSVFAPASKVPEEPEELEPLLDDEPLPDELLGPLDEELELDDEELDDEFAAGDASSLHAVAMTAAVAIEHQATRA